MLLKCRLSDVHGHDNSEEGVACASTLTCSQSFLQKYHSLPGEEAELSEVNASAQLQRRRGRFTAWMWVFAAAAALQEAGEPALRWSPA